MNILIYIILLFSFIGCENSNNYSSKKIDSYITNNFYIKLIDKNISQIFENPIKNNNKENFYLLKNIQKPIKFNGPCRIGITNKNVDTVVKYKRINNYNGLSFHLKVNENNKTINIKLNEGDVNKFSEDLLIFSISNCIDIVINNAK